MSFEVTFAVLKIGLLCLNLVLFVTAILALKKKVKELDKGEEERKGGVLLLIAHPDDEAMFFLPFLKNIQNQSREIFLECFSIGDSEGKGETRRRELLESCKHLGIKEENCIIHNHPQLKDSLSEKWKEELVSEKIEDTLRRNPTISSVITFDEKGKSSLPFCLSWRVALSSNILKKGVSGHPNHISLHNASKLVYQSLKRRREAKIEEKKEKEEKLLFFKLESVSLLRKYSSFLDIPFSFFLSVLPISNESTLHFTNASFFPSWRQMSIHNSQFVWYRKLSVLFSRYSYINTLLPLQ